MLALESQELADTQEATQVIARVPYFYRPAAKMLVEHTAPVNIVTWSSDGSQLASGGDDRELIIWNGITDDVVTALEGDMSGVNHIAWSPDGLRLAAESDVVIQVWNVGSGQVIAKFQGHMIGLSAESYITNLAFSPDGSKLASVGDDQTVIIWDMYEGRPVTILENGHTGSISSLAWSPNGSRIATGSDNSTLRPGDSTVILWDITSRKTIRPFTPLSILSDGSPSATVNVTVGEIVYRLRGHTGGVNSVAFSPDGTKLASGADDDDTVLWDVANGQPAFVLTGHTGEVNSVSFSPTGEKLASASQDEAVIIWEIDDDQLPKALSGHSDEITSLKCRPDGLQLASGTHERLGAGSRM